MSRRTALLQTSFDFAAGMIREKIDGEHKFEPSATYEMTGDQLQHYLAFAYREGTTYGTSKNSPSARGRSFPSQEGPVAPRAKSLSGEAEQKPQAGEPRVGHGNVKKFLRRLDDGPKGPKPLKDP